MKPIKKNIIISLIIAFLSLVFDQAYHIIFGLYHQIFSIFTDPYTSIYIISKFLLVFIISMIVLKIKIKSIFWKSAIIGVVAAFLFSLILTYLFPYLYTIWLHMFHAFAIFAAAIITLWAEKKWMK